MSEKLFTTIKTDEGIVKIPQDDIELQKVVSLIYSMDIEIDQLKAQIEELRKVIIEYEREAARERIRKRRGYAPMVRRN